MNSSIDDLILRYPALAPLEDELEKALVAMQDTFRKGNKVLVCGNGGSAADADHIVGELMKGFLRRRPLSTELRTVFASQGSEAARYIADRLQMPLPAVSLVQNGALGSAIANDIDPSLVFAQQVLGLGRSGDILLAISTSGNSKNVLHAAMTARVLGLTVIALTGCGGGALKQDADICLSVPGIATHEVQELHLPVYHALCKAVEETFFG